MSDYEQAVRRWKARRETFDARDDLGGVALCNEALSQLVEGQRARNELHATRKAFRELLADFTEAGNIGFPVRRTGWISEGRLERLEQWLED